MAEAPNPWPQPDGYRAVARSPPVRPKALDDTEIVWTTRKSSVKTPSFVEEKSDPPVLDLGEIRLRPLRPGDEHALFEYMTDARVLEHTSIPLMDLETLAAGVERDIAAYAAGTSCRWALALDDRLIGICGFNNWSFVHEHAELAYDLSPSHWGRGYMRRAVTAALHWAFETGFNRVHAFVMTSNARSIAVLESRGFTREGTLREFRLARGTPRDFHVYSLLRRDFRRPPGLLGAARIGAS